MPRSLRVCWRRTSSSRLCSRSFSSGPEVIRRVMLPSHIYTQSSVRPVFRTVVTISWNLARPDSCTLLLESTDCMAGLTKSSMSARSTSPSGAFDKKQPQKTRIKFELVNSSFQSVSNSRSSASSVLAQSRQIRDRRRLAPRLVPILGSKNRRMFAISG